MPHRCSEDNQSRLIFCCAPFDIMKYSIPKLSVEKFSEKKFFFPIQKLGWRFIGFWPGSASIANWQIALAFYNVFLVLIYAVFQLMFCYSINGDLVILLDALLPCVAHVVSAVKALMIILKRKEIKEILNSLEKSFCLSKNCAITTQKFLTFNPFRLDEGKRQDSRQILSGFLLLCADLVCDYQPDSLFFLVATGNQKYLPTVNGGGTEI